MAITKESVLEALKGVQDPDLKRDLGSLGGVKRVAACDGYVSATLWLPGGGGPPAREKALRDAQQAIGRAAEQAGEALQGLQIEFVNDRGEVTARHGDANAASAEPSAGASGGSKGAPAETPQAHAESMPGVKHVIAVGAGKGGVGKSTVAVNLAVGLARRGHAVGLMDGDIYGPSVPTLMGLGGLEPNVVDNMIQPFFVHGVKTMTIGKLVAPDKPLVWRGPMAHGAFKQIATQTQWGELDYLVIDLPPGTGDVPLTMAQLLSLDGAIIVCTPQKVAQDDAVRAAKMFEQLGVEVLGVVENMSYFIGDDGKEYDIFGRGGAEKMAERLGVTFLGAVPINMKLREASDFGDPTVNFEDGGTLAEELSAFAERVEERVAAASMQRAERAPTLNIS